MALRLSVAAGVATSKADAVSTSNSRFAFGDVERNARSIWAARNPLAALKKRNEALGGRKFLHVDGPPYTTGQVHLGTTWNKTLKDLIIRHRLMRGFAVEARSGFVRQFFLMCSRAIAIPLFPMLTPVSVVVQDMHGLPTEKAVEKQLGISGKAAIQQLGVDTFMTKCRELCLQNMNDMIVTFKHLGFAWDFDEYVSFRCPACAMFPLISGLSFLF
jgi:isoleucyl-tRNA synthetase